MAVQNFLYNSGRTDLIVHIQPDGLATIANQSAFEDYNYLHWSTYRYPATEGEPGWYYYTLPTWLTTGYYLQKPYIEVDGTATNDLPLGSNRFFYQAETIPSPIPAPAVYSGVWRLSGSNDTDDTNETLYINAGDTVPLAFSFQRFLELQQGASLSAASVSVTAGATVGTATIYQFLAVANFSGAANGAAYTVTVNATFSNGTQVVRTRKLLIS